MTPADGGTMHFLFVHVSPMPALTALLQTALFSPPIPDSSLWALSPPPKALFLKIVFTEI